MSIKFTELRISTVVATGNIGSILYLDKIFDQQTYYTIDQSKINFNKDIKKTKLVMSGGGVKGICHIGALYALEQLGILKNIITYVGSSVGAMVSVFLYIGYDIMDIYKMIELIDFSKIKEIIFENLLTQYGLDNGNKITIVFNKMFVAKNINPNITFKDMHVCNKKTLIITATCVNDKKVYYFSHETSPDMPIIIALRMSISIPLYFTPVLYKGNLYIDGGCIDNYPIHLFNNSLNKNCMDEVIGLCISNIKNTSNDINNIEEYVYHTIQCLMEGHTINSIKGYEYCSIKIESTDVSSVDFTLDKIAKQKLFDNGYNTAMKYYIDQ